MVYSIDSVSMEVLHKYITLYRHMEASCETGIHYSIDRSIVQIQLRAFDIDGICIASVCMHSVHTYIPFRTFSVCMYCMIHMLIHKYDIYIMLTPMVICLTALMICSLYCTIYGNTYSSL